METQYSTTPPTPQNNHIESAGERWARIGYNWFNQHRLLFGFGMLIGLTVISICFNVNLGFLSSDPNHWTALLFPLGYSFLDISLLALLMCLSAGAIRNIFVWSLSVSWSGLLLALSLFACLTSIMAMDAKKGANGDEFRRAELVQSLALAKESVETAQTNYNNTQKYKKLRLAELTIAKSDRDQLIKSISALDSVTPPSQVVFEKMIPTVRKMGFKEVSPDDLKLYSRFIFGVALVVTPLVLTLVLSHVFGSAPAPTPAPSTGGGGGTRSGTNNHQNQNGPTLSQGGPSYGGAPVHYSSAGPNGGNVYDFKPVAAVSPVSEADPVSVNDRGPQTEPQPEPEQGSTSKRTRKTGMDRDVVQDIFDYVFDTDETLAENQVAKRFGVGKTIVRGAYKMLEGEGVIYKEGTGKPWKRTETAYAERRTA